MAKDKNLFSVDLEDWFHPLNYPGYIKNDEWDNHEKRVQISTGKILDLLDKYNTEATFFVLGWIAEKQPELIQEIKNRGHEIATHGYNHMPVTSMSPDEFKDDFEKSLSYIEKACGVDCKGYRAPRFTITNKTLWALDIIKSFGIEYDSSVFPYNMHPEYGIDNAPLEPYQIHDGIYEIPMSCAVVMGKRIPCSGGGYFRLYPYSVFKYLSKNVINDGRILNFYLHPWEIDTEHKVPMKMSKKETFRHYQNLGKTYSRLEKLFNDFQFTSFRNYLKDDSQR